MYCNSCLKMRLPVAIKRSAVTGRGDLYVCRGLGCGTKIGIFFDNLKSKINLYVIDLEY